MAATIDIPDFDFTGFYYPEILEALLAFKRQNLPELTDESPQEPATQFLRAFALVGHLNNVLIDLLANESTLPTSRLPEQVRNMLRLIDFEVPSASPAQAELVLELSKVLTLSTEVIPQFAQFATRSQGGNPAIFFEALTALTVSPTNAVLALAEESGIFADVTTEANDPTTPASDFTPWATPVAGDKLYIGHAEAMWEQLDLLFTTPGGGLVGVWEFHDGNFDDEAPDLVVDQGATLRFNINVLLGTSNRAGAQVRVRLNESTALQDVISSWDGFNNFVETSLLGQTSPSVDPDDYTVGVDWEELRLDEDIVGAALGVSGKVKFFLPQTLGERWSQVEVNGVSAFWLRFRIVSVAGPTAPVFQTVLIDQEKQFVLTNTTQGRRQADTNLGSSTGLPNQRFETSRDSFVDGSETVTVDGDTWIPVENFLNSKPTDRHYAVELGENDRASVVFSDGVAGRIPPPGVNNISAVYRFDVVNDGNVGRETIEVDKTGLTFISSVANPRPASGWAPAAGSTPESLERVKVEGPASLRARQVATSPDDVETLTATFEDEGGSRPFSRSLAIEEGFGPKTIELVAVAQGGQPPSVSQLDALTLFFNGDRFVFPSLPKRIVANQEVTAVSFSPKPIDIVATVFGEFETAQVVNQLSRVLQPDAIREDGVSFEWEFGTEVPRSRLIHEIFETDQRITKVILATPAADVLLDVRELPIPGTITILKGV